MESRPAINVIDTELLRIAKLEAESRPIRFKRLEIIDYRPTSQSSADPLGLPGSVTLFLTRKGDSVLEELKHAAVSQDGNDERLTRELRAVFESRTVLPLDKAVNLVTKQDVIADLRYLGNTVAQNMCVPEDLRVAVVGCPYNGGPLDSSGFTLVERHRSETSGELDGFILRCSPDLTKAEAAALQQIPEEHSELHVGSAHLCFALCGIAVTAAVAVTSAAFTCGVPTYLNGLSVHLVDGRVAEIPPHATARQLLAIRRQLLAGR